MHQGLIKQAALDKNSKIRILADHAALQAIGELRYLNVLGLRMKMLENMACRIVFTYQMRRQLGGKLGIDQETHYSAA